LAKGYCPVCGRYVGPLTRCPYCGADIPRERSYILLKRLAVVLAVAGLLSLWAYASHVPYKRVYLSELGPTYNYAYVRVDGVVSSVPYLAKRPDGTYALYFDVDDGTAVASVHVYHTGYMALRKAGVAIMLGDRVSLAVQVRFLMNSYYLILNGPSFILEQERPEPVKAQVRDVLNGKYGIGTWVSVEGVLTDVSYLEEYKFIRAYLSQGGTSVMVYLPFNFCEYLGEEPEEVFAYLKLLEGSKVRVDAPLMLYGFPTGGEWELVPVVPQGVQPA